MKTTDEIKAAQLPSAEDDCRKCGYYKAKATCQQDVAADALAYILRLEAELAATREALDRDGDLCRICKYNAAPRPESECDLGCMTCTSKHCACKKCLQSAATEGFEWAGGQHND